MTPEQWLLLKSGPGDSDFNMAFDEALLEAMPRLGMPVLRFYGWTEPAASFGYFQSYSDVERLTSLRPLVRRPTGGGLVPHDQDWTYSLAVPPRHDWYSLKAVESYQRIHTWIQHAFALMDLNAVLAPLAQKSLPGQCFVGHEQFDLLWNARKIAGAAQRRRRDGLLIQGSVQPPLKSINRADWQKAICAAGEQQYGIQWKPWAGDPILRARADQLRAQKYSRADFNRKK